MDTKKIIEKAKIYDNEDLQFELKQTSKFLNKKNKLDPHEIAKMISGFANREGGYLIIGIKDDGTPEGQDIFNIFSTSTKTGIDKFKEYIINSCNSKISPIINIVVTYHNYEKYEFISVSIPKRISIPHAVVEWTGNKINKRTYFIKTSHSFDLVSDSQLEWLFDGGYKEIEESNFFLEATTFKNLKGIPIPLRNTDLLLQPRSTEEVFDYLLNLNDDAREKCLNNTSIGYRKELFTEILFYCLFHSDIGRFRIIHSEAISLPLPTKDMLLSSALNVDITDFFNNFTRKVYFPPLSKQTIRKEKNKVILEIINEFIVIEFQLFLTSWGLGVSSMNPYYDILMNDFGQDHLFEKFETYKFVLKTKVRRLFPEVINQEFYSSYEYANTLKKRIKKCWDINYYFENLPHYRKLYSIEYKLNKVLKKLK